MERRWALTVRGRVTGGYCVLPCGQRLLWRHRSPLGQGLGKGLLPQLRTYPCAHPLIVSTLVRQRQRQDLGEIGWAARLPSRLGCPPHLCCPGGKALPRHHSSPFLQTGSAALLVIQLLEQGQALLIEGISCRQVTHLSRDLPQAIERLHCPHPLPQGAEECEALLEECAGRGSISLLEVQESQAIECVGHPGLDALLSEEQQAFLEQRADPWSVAVAGMSEDRQREGYECVREADLVPCSPGECQALFEPGGGPRGVAEPQGDPPQ